MTYVAQTPPAANTTLPSSFLDQMVINDQSFHSGTGIANLEVGAVTTVKNDYKFSAYRNAALTAPEGTATLITFDTKSFDTGTNYSTSTGEFTAPVAGYYQVNFAVGAVFTGSNSYALVMYKNGASFINPIVQTYIGASGNEILNGAKLLSLNANDYIQMYFYNGSSTNLTINIGLETFFEGFLVANT